MVGSGDVVHNRSAVSRAAGDTGSDRARRFDERVREVLLEQPAEVAALDGHSDHRLAVPTPDHFVPLRYVAGLAAAAGTTAEILVDGFTHARLAADGRLHGRHAGARRSPRRAPSQPAAAGSCRWRSWRGGSPAVRCGSRRPPRRGWHWWPSSTAGRAGVRSASARARTGRRGSAGCPPVRPGSTCGWPAR
nr:hypothetical protein [Geodermatophilus pulveris]